MASEEATDLEATLLLLGFVKRKTLIHTPMTHTQRYHWFRNGKKWGCGVPNAHVDVRRFKDGSKPVAYKVWTKAGNFFKATRLLESESEVITIVEKELGK